jgi:hypothetical protein
VIGIAGRVIDQPAVAVDLAEQIERAGDAMPREAIRRSHISGTMARSRLQRSHASKYGAIDVVDRRCVEIALVLEMAERMHRAATFPRGLEDRTAGTPSNRIRPESRRICVIDGVNTPSR